MKKDWLRFWVLIGIVVFGISFWIRVIACLAQDIDIPSEERPSVNKIRIGDTLFHHEDRSAILTLRKGYLDGTDFIIVTEIPLIWKDQVDNPETPENEATTEYTDFVNAVINKQALRTKVLEKLQ